MIMLLNFNHWLWDALTVDACLHRTPLDVAEHKEIPEEHREAEQSDPIQEDDSSDSESDNEEED